MTGDPSLFMEFEMKRAMGSLEDDPMCWMKPDYTGAGLSLFVYEVIEQREDERDERV